MREDQLLELLGEAADRHVLAADQPVRKRKPWRRRLALAACLCLAVGFSAWGWRTAPEHIPDASAAPAQTPAAPVPVGGLLSPAGRYEEQELRVSMLPLLGRIAEYHQVRDAGQDKLEEAVGEALDGAEGWYRLLGHEELQYLLTRAEDGSLSLWEFACFQVWDEDMREQVREGIASGNADWGETAWFHWDLDVSPYSYHLVLEDIYGIRSADDILSITVQPANMSNTDAGKALQQEIGTCTVTGREEIAAVYQAISGMECLGGNRWEDIGLEENLLEAVRQGRYLILHMADGAVSSLKYTASSGQFYEYGGVAYTPLEAETAEEVSRILGIG